MGEKDRHIIHLEDDVMKYRNFVKELHKLIHKFEKVTEKPIIEKFIEGVDNGNRSNDKENQEGRGDTEALL